MGTESSGTALPASPPEGGIATSASARARLRSIAGPLEFAQGGILGQVPGLDPLALSVIFVLLMAGLGVKAALVPLHRRAVESQGTSLAVIDDDGDDAGVPWMIGHIDAENDLRIINGDAAQSGNQRCSEGHESANGREWIAR